MYKFKLCLYMWKSKFGLNQMGLVGIYASQLIFSILYHSFWQKLLSSGATSSQEYVEYLLKYVHCIQLSIYTCTEYGNLCRVEARMQPSWAWMTLNINIKIQMRPNKFTFSIYLYLYICIYHPYPISNM